VGQVKNVIVQAAIIDDTSKEISLQAFSNEYTEFIKQSKSKHYLISVRHTMKFLIDYVGNIPLAKLNRRSLEKFLLMTFSRTQRSASLFYRNLKAAFTKAEDWGYLKDNPLRKYKLPKIAKSFPSYISFDELLMIVDKEPREELRKIYLFAYYTGMRRAEILNLTWKSVDFAKNMIQVSNTDGFTTKSKKERLIPICEPLFEILQEIDADFKSNAYVFTTESGKMFYDDYVGKQFKKAVIKAKVNDKIHFHSLRHSFASTLVQNSVPINVVKELLGHSDIATTMVYSHLKNDNLIEAISVFGKTKKIA